jgi:hypothetical protein
MQKWILQHIRYLAIPVNGRLVFTEARIMICEFDRRHYCDPAAMAAQSWPGANKHFSRRWARARLAGVRS